MRKGQNFFQLPVTCRRGTKAEGGQPGVGKAVKSRAGGSDRPVDRPSAGRPPSLVSYCMNRRHLNQPPAITREVIVLYTMRGACSRHEVRVDSRWRAAVVCFQLTMPWPL